MKYNKIIGITLAALFYSLSIFASEGFKITGKISGNSEGKTIYLFSGTDIIIDASRPKISILDSTTIKNGIFEFKGKLEMPTILTLKIYLDDERGMAVDNKFAFRPIIPIFMENEIVNIDATLEDIPLENFEGIYDYSKVEMTGSSLHNLYMEYMEKKIQLHNEKMESYKSNQTKNDNTISENIKVVERIDLASSIRKNQIINLIKSNKDNYLGLFIFKDNKDLFSVEEINELTFVFVPVIKNSKYAEEVFEEINETKKSALGAYFVDYTLNDKDGNSVRFSDYLGKGKYVLLEFWASWCGPCRADIPHLKEVYELYNPKGFEIISVSMDATEQMWKAALEKEQMPWLQVSDLKAFEGDLHHIYNFEAIPACVLISPEGKIVDRNMRGTRMDKKLIEIYGNLFGDKY